MLNIKTGCLSLFYERPAWFRQARREKVQSLIIFCKKKEVWLNERNTCTSKKNLSIKTFYLKFYLPPFRVWTLYTSKLLTCKSRASYLNVKKLLNHVKASYYFQSKLTKLSNWFLKTLTLLKNNFVHQTLSAYQNLFASQKDTDLEASKQWDSRILSHLPT